MELLSTITWISTIEVQDHFTVQERIHATFWFCLTETDDVFLRLTAIVFSAALTPLGDHDKNMSSAMACWSLNEFRLMPLLFANERTLIVALGKGNDNECSVRLAPSLPLTKTKSMTFMRCFFRTPNLTFQVKILNLPIEKKNSNIQVFTPAWAVLKLH